MILSRNRLYLLLFTACLSGYIWLYISLTHTFENKSVDVCIIKHVTNIPCPSCGSTRSILALIQGYFTEALLLNPLGYVISIIMLVAPIWITIDVITKHNSLLRFYQKVEIFLKKPKYAIPLIILILINWIWNYKKGL